MANKKLRFYILTTAKEDYKGIYQKTDFETFEENSLEDLGRHFSPRWSNLDYKDAVIVINTLSRQYEIDCSKWCEERGLEYHITKSNGKPGRGKNAVVDVFEASNDDYCVPIDGDDYLTPYGVWFYKKLAEQDNPPDALCIYNSWMCSNYIWGQRYHYNFFKAYRNYEVYRPSLMRLMKERIYLSKRKGGETLKGLNKEIAKYGSEEKMLEQYIKWDLEHHNICLAANEFYDDIHFESFARVTWYSKKICRFRTFEHMGLGEDLYMYLLLKDAHVRGNINMARHREMPATYVYNQASVGHTASISQTYGSYLWMGAFNSVALDLQKQGRLHRVNLPDIDLYEEGAPHDYGVSRTGQDEPEFELENNSWKITNYTGKRTDEINNILKMLEFIQGEYTWEIDHYQMLRNKNFEILAEDLCKAFGQTLENHSIVLNPPLKNLPYFNASGMEASPRIIE